MDLLNLPRLDKDKRGGIYPILRAFTTVLMRELNITTLIGDMFAGYITPFNGWMARATAEPKLTAQQVMLFRSYVKLLFSPNLQ